MIRDKKKIPKTWENIRKLISVEKRQQDFVYKIIKILFFVVFIVLGLLTLIFMIFIINQYTPQEVIISSLYGLSYITAMTLLLAFTAFVYPRVYLLDQLELFTIHRDYVALIRILKKRLADIIIASFLTSYIIVLEYIGITILKTFINNTSYAEFYRIVLETTYTTHCIWIGFGLLLFIFYKRWGEKLIVTQMNRYLNIVQWSNGSIKITDTDTYPEV